MTTLIHMKGLEELHNNAQTVLNLTGDVRPFKVTTEEVDRYVEEMEFCLKEMEKGLEMIRKSNEFMKKEGF